MNTTFFTQARFVVPWQVIAITIFLGGLLMGALLGGYRDTVVQTGVACRTGEPVVAESDLRIALSCATPDGVLNTQLRQADMVLAVLRERIPELLCNIRRNGVTDTCTKP